VAASLLSGGLAEGLGGKLAKAGVSSLLGAVRARFTKDADATHALTRLEDDPLDGPPWRRLAAAQTAGERDAGAGAQLPVQPRGCGGGRAGADVDAEPVAAGRDGDAVDVGRSGVFQRAGAPGRRRR